MNSVIKTHCPHWHLDVCGGGFRKFLNKGCGACDFCYQEARVVQDDYRKSHGPVNGEYGGLSAMRKKKKIKLSLVEEDPLPALGRTRAQTGGAQTEAPVLGSGQAAVRAQEVAPALGSGSAEEGAQELASTLVAGEAPGKPPTGSWRHDNLRVVIPSQVIGGGSSLPMKVDRRLAKNDVMAKEEAIHNEEDPLGGRNEKVHAYTLLPL